MNKLHYLLLAFIIILSCSKDKDVEEITTPVEEAEPEIIQKEKGQGRQAFTLDFSTTSSKDLSIKGIYEIVYEGPNNSKSGFALISIKDSVGELVFNREKVDVLLTDKNYVTSELELEAGTYSLTEFILIDVNEIAIAMVPQAKASLGKLTENSLPISFTIKDEELTVTKAENIGTDGYTKEDFGYDNLDLDFPNSTDFFSLVVDETIGGKPKSIVIESMTNSVYQVDWGDGTIEKYYPDLGNVFEVNELKHTYKLPGLYTIEISGPLETIQGLRFYSTYEGGAYSTNLISADLSKLKLLNNLELYYGKLTTLNTSENTLLESLELGYNEIETLDLKNNLELKNLSLHDNQLANLDISKNKELEFLWLATNQISSIDIQNNTALKVVSFRENQLRELDLSKNISLVRIDISDNKLSELSTSNNISLGEINVGRNLLTGIDFSKNVNLERIDLYGNKIVDIDLSFNTKLKNLYINNNLLEIIDISNNVEIDRLIVEGNNLTTLDITNNPKIFDLEIGGNQFSGKQLDEIISLVYDRTVSNSIFGGYINFKNNPGTEELDDTTLQKINDLVVNYNWFFNNNN